MHSRTLSTSPAMLAATMKSSKGKGKKRLKLKKHKIKCTNTNCGRMGHTKDQCFAKGRGKEREAPEWFKKLAERKAVSASVNVVEKTNNNNSENYTMLTYSLPDDPTALIVTSDFKAEADALAISNLSGIILDSGAGRHFSPDCLKLLNFQEINPEPIRAADRHTFSMFRKGDLKVELSNENQKSTRIYWPKKYKISVKRDVYFDKNWALEPDEVLIEGSRMYSPIWTLLSLLTPLKMFHTCLAKVLKLKTSKT